MSLEREKKAHLLRCDKESALETGALVTHTLDNDARGMIVATVKNEYCEVFWSKTPETIDYKTYKTIQASLDNILHKDFDIASSALTLDETKLNYVPLSHISKLIKQ